MKILLLTKINPIEVYDVMMRLYRSTLYTSHTENTLIYSAQYTAMLACEKVKTGLQDMFYPALNVWDREKDNIIKSHSVQFLVVVGSDYKKNNTWYDAIISLENKNIEDYELDEDFNTTHQEVLTTKDADIQFTSIDEVYTFLSHAQKIFFEEQQNGHTK